jgi:hypothetical protein
MRPSSSDELKSGRPLIESEPRPFSEKLPTENHARLVDLLSYLEHLAKLGEKPVFALKEYQSLVFTEEELKGQIGITHDISTDDGHVWLRIERPLKIWRPGANWETWCSGPRKLRIAER